MGAGSRVGDAVAVVLGTGTGVTAGTGVDPARLANVGVGFDTVGSGTVVAGSGEATTAGGGTGALVLAGAGPAL